MAVAFAGSSRVSAASVYAPVNGGTADIDVMFAMDKETITPAVEISFKIEAGSALNATSGNVRIFAGPVSANAPAIGKAVFTEGQAQYNTSQDTLTTGRNTSDGTAVIQVIPAALPGGGTFDASKHVFSHSKATVNFSGISFTEPGVYRYKIKETAASPAQGIMLDTSEKYMDVYVEDTGATAPALEVTGYVLHDSASGMPVSGTPNPSGKAFGFTNLYAAHNLRISKTVTGNAGSRDEYFEFTVKLTNAQPGTKYRIAGNYDSTVPANATIGTAANTNPSEITVGSNGSVQQTFWLQNAQYVIIQGLANETKYTIAENDTTMNNEGYTTTIAKSPNTPVVSGRTVTSPETGIGSDTIISYTNRKNNVVPTGIFESAIPGTRIIILAVSGYFLLSNRRLRKVERN